MTAPKAKLIRKMRGSCSDLFILNYQSLYEVRTEEAFEVSRLMQMSEKYEHVLKKMDNEDRLTEQMIVEFEESRVTRNDSFDSIIKHNIQNALEE